MGVGRQYLKHFTARNCIFFVTTLYAGATDMSKAMATTSSLRATRYVSSGMCSQRECDFLSLFLSFYRQT